MNNSNRKKGSDKKLSGIFLSWTLIFLTCYAILEVTALRWLPHIFPIASIMRYLDPDIQMLAQYSKKHLLPENYIAILGDSYAFGQGDSLYDKQSEIAPSYNAPHWLQKNISQDIVTFGRPASSSIKAYLEDPLSQLAYIRALQNYPVKDPAVAILYFYEGNDVTDNWIEFQVRYKNQGFDVNRLQDQEYFSYFIDNDVLGKNKTYKKSIDGSFTNKLVLGRFIVDLIRGESERLFKEFLGKFHSKNHKPIFKPQPRDLNTVRISGLEQKIPDGLQVPPIALHDSEIDTSMKIFEQTLRQIKKRWPDTKFGLVYIPAVGTVYQVVSETINIYDKERGKNYSAALLLPSSDATCRLVRRITVEQGISFLDARAAIRQAAQQDFLHGPVDWLHFNEDGYRVLADEIEKLLKQLYLPAPSPDCAALANQDHL